MRAALVALLGSAGCLRLRGFSDLPEELRLELQARSRVPRN